MQCSIQKNKIFKFWLLRSKISGPNHPASEKKQIGVGRETPASNIDERARFRGLSVANGRWNSRRRGQESLLGKQIRSLKKKMTD